MPKSKHSPPSALRTVLAENLRRLMDEAPGGPLGNAPAARLAKCVPSSIRRILAEEMSASVDLLAGLAEGFHVTPEQLLAKDLGRAGPGQVTEPAAPYQAPVHILAKHLQDVNLTPERLRALLAVIETFQDKPRRAAPFSEMTLEQSPAAQTEARRSQ